MCGPAALPLAAAALAAAGSITGGLAANAQARFQAKIAERNASMEREAARQELENGRDAALDHYRKIGQLKGAQRARAAAGGVGVDFGTAAAVVDDTEMLGREDAGRLYKQTLQNVRGHDIQASNFGAQANAQRASGKMALIKAGFDTAGSLLDSANQYKNLQPKSQTYDRGYDGIY
jgi:hypothetical protein